MTQEEKLEEAKRLYKDANADQRYVLERLFPELEDEDERIRQKLLFLCYSWRNNEQVNIPDKKEVEKTIAWLKKQGNIDLEFFENGENKKREFVGYGFLKCKGDFLSFKEGETYWLEYMGKDNYNVRSDNLLGQTFHITPQQLYTVFRPTTWLEKQGEQEEPQVYETENGEVITYSETDGYKVVEPKFKKGDWVAINSELRFASPLCIKDTDNDNYRVESVDGNSGTPTIDYLDNHYHLWTIQDAKDGDVLAAHECLVLFREIDGLNIRCYCTYHFMNNQSFYVDTLQNKNAFHPATKEQRDLLFRKVEETGYECLLIKKESKKIEQKPADVESKFHEGDLVIVSTAEGDRVVQIASVEYLKDGHPSYFTTGGRWFGNGTKARLLSDKDVETITLPESKIIVSQNPAWSEEDEHWRQKVIDFIKHPDLIKATPTLAEHTIEWLISLKERVQPQNISYYNPYKAVVESIAEMCKHYDKASHSGLRDFYDNIKVKCKDVKEYDSLYSHDTWKPSDEQMERLKGIIYSLPHQEVLYSLYQDLKKLKE